MAFSTVWSVSVISAFFLFAGGGCTWGEGGLGVAASVVAVGATVSICSVGGLMGVGATVSMRSLGGRVGVGASFCGSGLEVAAGLSLISMGGGALP